MIVDTDVMIWALRGQEKAKAVLTKTTSFSITSVTYMELLQGMRDKSELAFFVKAIQEMSITIEHIDTTASIRAVEYIKEYSLSHSLELADALNAAIVISLGEELLTANDKHYKVIPGLTLKIFRP